MHRYDEIQSGAPSRQLCTSALSLNCITTDDRSIPEENFGLFVVDILEGQSADLAVKRPCSFLRDTFRRSRMLILPVTLIRLLYTLKVLFEFVRTSEFLFVVLLLCVSPVISYPSSYLKTPFSS